MFKNLFSDIKGLQRSFFALLKNREWKLFESISIYDE